MTATAIYLPILTPEIKQRQSRIKSLATQGF